ncbi:hypothetical protein GQ43DRAFT_287693 [Delitschia confertaspora ATCC 74209]|uniref:Rhodopsin domain-containing protein n=1 Tax=Delitschia confertaspora ATCC 74209 TaxID=1513339 RepID=A0A9P4MTS5_9PLEO|nr:hypothetical protein GQ43DRAFT_287693 [Delitschia confertaspora ATCC 74209]
MPSPMSPHSTNTHTSVVNICIWLGLILSGLSVIAKVFTKCARIRRQYKSAILLVDDYVLLLAMILAIAHSITASHQMSFAKRRDEMQTRDALLEGYQKSRYAAQLVYVATILAVKVAVILFGFLLEPPEKIKKALKLALGIIILWFMVTFFIVAFQCSPPRTWDIREGKCLNQAFIWSFAELFSTVIDCSLIAILGCIVMNLQHMHKAKYILMLVFSLRSLSVIPIGFKLHYIFQLQSASRSNLTNEFFNEENLVITTAMTMNTNIVVTCIPFMKTVMEYLQPGWSTSDVRQGAGYNMMSTRVKGGKVLFPRRVKDTPLVQTDTSLETPSWFSSQNGVSRDKMVPQNFNGLPTVQ